jgi:hypothetical protein
LKITQDLLDLAFTAAWKIIEPRVSKYLPQVCGGRLLAIDGTKVNLPRSESIKEAFGCPKGGAAGRRVHQPQVLVVVLVDVLTRKPLGYVVLPHDGSERAGARELLHHLKAGDILLFDRGYHSRALIVELKKVPGLFFIFRMCGGKKAWTEIRAAQKKKIVDATIMVDAGGLTPLRHLTYTHSRGRPRNGTRKEPMYLLTNLPRLRFRPGRIRELYRARWGIETMNRELKIALDGEHFHARTCEGIRQELSILFMMLALGALADVAAKAAAGIEIDDPLDPHRKECNRVAVFAIIAAVIAHGASHASCLRAHGALRSLGRRAHAKRPWRKFERTCKGVIGRWKLVKPRKKRNKSQILAQ